MSFARALFSSAIFPFSFFPNCTLYPSIQKTSIESLCFTFLFCIFFGRSISIFATSFASCITWIKRLRCSIFERSDSSSICRCFIRCFAFLLFVKNISLIIKGVGYSLGKDTFRFVPS